jgi:hypothetical protein
MTEHSQAGPDLDSRLAQLDRRLREIQADLIGDESVELLTEQPPRAAPPPEPEPPPEPAPLPEPEPLPPPVAQSRLSAPDAALRPPIGHGRSGPLADLLAHLQARPGEFGEELSDLKVLVSDLHETLDGIEEVLQRLAGGGRRTRTTKPEAATIAAGPFTTLDSVRAFERELTTLPGVQEAAVRGYEGAARAIIDVRFGEDH